MKVFVKNKLIFQSINAFALIAILLNVFAPVVYANNLKQQLHYQKLLRSIASKNIELFQNETIGMVNQSKTDLDLVTDNPSSNKVKTQFKNVSSVAGGPGQSETSGFSISSTDGLVDKFTGDFSYSIPLADVEGYPIMLTYNSNINMNTEASWVGLGWDLNVGAVNRSMRGLPDEFNGEQTIIKTFNQMPDITDGKKNGGFLAFQQKNGIGGSKYAGIGIQATALWGKYDNTYLGPGKTFDFGLQASVSVGYESSGAFVAPTFGWGYSSDSKRGIGTNFNYGLSAGKSEGSSSSTKGIGGVTFGKSFHSRQGLQAKTLSLSSNYNDRIISTSTSFPYGTITSIPSVKFNSHGETGGFAQSYFLGYDMGAVCIKAGFLHTNYNTNISISKNSNSQIIQPAIGYFHNSKYQFFANSKNSYGNELPLMDFNRTNDEPYSENMVNLPFSFQTFDMFSASAMGLGEVFRGRRSDVGSYQDATSTMSNDVNSGNLNFGLSFGASYIIEIATDGGASFGESNVTSGPFNSSSDPNERLKFSTAPWSSKFDESVYFKASGELTPEDLSDLEALGSTNLAYPTFELSSNKKEISLSGNLYIKDQGTQAISQSTLNQPDNVIVANYFKPYTAEEYSQLAGESSFNFVNAVGATINQNRVQTNLPNNRYYKNHISAVEAVNTDGMRYVFDIPAYEISSSQVSFSIVGETDPENDGLVSYIPGSDNSIYNTRGTSRFYDKTTVPAYPHSFLLTEILSSDYIDRTDNGPSLDDIGNYYHFKYKRVYGENNHPFNWRFPVASEKAAFNRGMLGTNLDDMANYSYGQKEIWYVDKVESKNIVAEFILTERFDVCAVDENGSLIESDKLMKLDSIVIYNRSERTSEQGASAIPLSIIKFNYTYDLCQNYPTNTNPDNTQRGKLTLVGIQSYSGRHEEMSVYSYSFKYGEVNPDFSYVTDAWGNNKTIDPQKPNDVFPYTEQNQSISDMNAKAWRLHEIITPTNGFIDIAYESDSYKTVQNQKAMVHFETKGLLSLMDLKTILNNSSWNGTDYLTNSFYIDFLTNTPSNWSFAKNFLENFGKINIVKGKRHVPNNVLVFKLGTGINGSLSISEANKVLKEDYFKDVVNSSNTLKKIFIKQHVSIKDDVTELVPMFADIAADYGNFSSIGVLPASNSNFDYSYGYVVLTPSIVKDKDGEKAGKLAHPIQKAAIEFARRNLPDVVYGATASASADQAQILDKSVALYRTDINALMDKKDWVQSIINDFSSVRLYTPTAKYGGNGRVQSITYRDKWEEVSGENVPGVYSWFYSYPERSASLGNAAFEPMGIIDECALYNWETYQNILVKFPDETNYTPTPIAAPLYPDPIIGYEKVKVSLNGGSNRGYSLTEYFTSFDYPVIFNKTDINKSIETDKPTNFITGKTTDRFALSQGYVIETNDFHGKQENASIYTLDENNDPVLQAQSIYVYEPLGAKLPMVKRNGTVSMENVAMQFDVHADTRYITNEFKHTEVNIGGTIKILSTVPYVLPFPTIGFTKTSRTEAFYSSALIKHINRSAVVSKIITKEYNSENTARNILYDYHSGNVLLSSLNDEYDDPLYSFVNPSHWYYKELREISASQNKRFFITLNGNGVISNMDHLLTPGDVIRNVNVPGSKVWIAKNNNVLNGDLYIMNIDGTNAFGVSGFSVSNSSIEVEIIKSNRDNRLNETMQSFVTKKKLFDETNLTVEFPLSQSSDIISSSAITYRDRNNVKCGVPSDKVNPYSNNEVRISHFVNPYLYGFRGDLVMDQQYNWQSERVQAAHPFKTRFDGVYQDFQSFYNLINGKWVAYTFPKEPPAPVSVFGWRPSSYITTFDVFGKPLETVNQINNFSAALYGYNSQLNLFPTASAVNARQQEIAFEGFEDFYHYSAFNVENNVPHIKFSNVVLSNEIRHSGIYSLKLSGLSSSISVSQIESACVANTVKDELDLNAFKVAECNCIDPFKPTYGKYIISAWVKRNDPNRSPLGNITVSIPGSSTPFYTFNGTGPIIDGWQRIEGVFEINGSSTEITISLNHLLGSSVYFDDVRVHPFMASMSTTVYDSKTLLPIATHDSNNFTTFYNYDLNNNLVRVRVETIEGIKTVSESEMGGFKKID